MAGKKVKVSVVADTKNFARAFKGLGRAAGLDKLVNGLKTVGVWLGRAAGIAAGAAGAAGIAAVKMGADLEQSMGAIDAVFKDSAGTMHRYADAAAKSAGLSKNSYNELATLLGSQLKNAYRGTGRSIQEIGKQTNDLIGLGADLSSMFGGTTKEAVEALSSALKGERDPIERYGVTLNQAAIDAKAAEMGFKKVAGSFDAEAQAAATLALIIEQTGDAHGNFAREQDTFTHQIQVGRAQIESFAQKLGMKLLPRLTELGQKFNTWLGPALDRFGTYMTGTVIPAVERAADTFATTWIPKIKEVGQWIGQNVVPALVSMGTALANVVRWVIDNATWLGQLAAIITGAVAAYKAYQQVLLIVQAAKVAVTAAQVALNAAMAANPVGILITLVGALIGGLIYLVTTNEDVRAKLVAAWNWIKDGVGNAIAAVGGWISRSVEWIQGIPGRISASLAAMRAGITTAFRTAWTAAVITVVTKVASVIAQVQAIPGRIRAGLSALGTTISTMFTNAWTSTITATGAKIMALITQVREIPGKIKAAVASRLKTVLTGPASDMIDGFVGGIRRGFNKVKSVLGKLTNLLPAWKGPAERDRMILRDAGQLVIDGFRRGLESRYGDVRRSLHGLTRDVAATRFDDLVGPAIRLSPALVDGGGTYPYRPPREPLQPITVNVYALDPTPEVGRRVSQALKQYLALGGGRHG